MNTEAKELPSQSDDASYYAIIPGPVLNSEDIPDGAKILYGIISTLTKKVSLSVSAQFTEKTVAESALTVIIKHRLSRNTVTILFIIF